MKPTSPAGGILLSEGEYGYAMRDECITYPWLYSCLGLTAIAPDGEKAGAHLLSPLGASHLDTYLMQLQAVWDFHKAKGAGVRFMVSCDHNPHFFRLGGGVETHRHQLAEIGTDHADACEEIWLNITRHGYSLDMHERLNDAGEIAACFGNPVHQILPDGSPAAYGEDVLLYAPRRIEQTSLY